MKATRGMLAMVAGLGLLSAGPAWAEDTARPASDPLAESKLELKIEGVISRDERLAQQLVIVETSKGVLTLSGTVATAADRTRVEEIARAAGAERIDNRLTVLAEKDQATEAARQPQPRQEAETPEKKQVTPPAPSRSGEPLRERDTPQ
jgi:hyperosmotically inducible periplasmic protein